MKRLKSLWFIIFASLFLVNLAACSNSDDDNDKENSTPTFKDYLEIPLDHSTVFDIPSGYRMEIADSSIVAPRVKFFDSPTTFLLGKKKGETTLTITNEKINFTKTISVKVTDNYISEMTTGSTHPVFGKDMFLFFINNDKHSFYLFNKENKEPCGSPVCEGTYEFSVKKETITKKDKEGKDISIEAPIPYLTLTYHSDKDGKIDTSAPLVAHKFRLDSSTDMALKGIMEYIKNINWEDWKHIFDPQQEATRSKATFGIGFVMQEVGTNYIVQGDLYDNYRIPEHVLE